MEKIAPIKTHREYRLLNALLKNNFLPVVELREVVGANNVPDVVRKLRKRGWAIPCSRIDFIDRDGKKCRPGMYYLNDDWKQKAAIALQAYTEEWEAATSHSMPES